MQRKIITWGLIVLVVGGGIFFIVSGQSSQQVVSVPIINTTGPEAKLLESKGLAEFDLSNDVKNTVNADDKARYKEVYDAMQIGGDLKNTVKVQQALAAMNNLISKYRDYTDLYVVRSMYSLILGNTDYAAINADLDNAQKYRQSTKYINSYDFDTPIYLLKAKVAALSGDTKTELDDLQNAIDVDPSSVYSGDFFGTGAVKPDGTSNPTALSLSDFDTLVQTYPTDFRAYELRGIFYASYVNFSLQLQEQYYSLAFADLKRAFAVNAQSAEVNYLLGELYMKTTFLTMAASSDISDITGNAGGYKDQQRNKALTYFNQAIAIDPNYKYAFAGAAEDNFELKNYADAIQDYTKEIALDPNNAGAYNDKALAETDIDQFSQAVSDLNKAIQLKQSNPKYENNGLISYDSYQNLGDVQVKAGDYTSAIASYSRAIGIDFASQLFLMSVDQIRAIYPEFNSVSDQDLLEGLRQKYFPNMTSTDFNSQMVKNKQNGYFILSDLYAARGDAYLKSGDTAKASDEYARAMHNDLQYQLKPDQQAVYRG